MKRRHIFLAAILAIAVTSLGRVGAQNNVPPDIARGRHIAVALSGCAHCHRANFAGGEKFTRGDFTVYSANLTAGAGGIATYSDSDLRRAIRIGKRPDGSAIVPVMPWREYAVMTDEDVNDVIAFLRSLPPVDNVLPVASGPAAPPPVSVPSNDGALRPQLTGGAYLAQIGGCTNCHGADLAGRPRPDGMLAPNISHDGIGSWSFADFQTAMRTGKIPEGRILSKAMPWEDVGKMTDDELRSVYDFLQSQPVRAK